MSRHETPLSLPTCRDLDCPICYPPTSSESESGTSTLPNPSVSINIDTSEIEKFAESLESIGEVIQEMALPIKMAEKACDTLSEKTKKKKVEPPNGLTIEEANKLFNEYKAEHQVVNCFYDIGTNEIFAEDGDGNEKSVWKNGVWL